MAIIDYENTIRIDSDDDDIGDGLIWRGYYEVILPNERFLSSLPIDQVVSWLYENKGITIPAAQVWGLREVLGVENIPLDNWMPIHKNRRLLSSLTAEQAVSWLFVNKGITITAAQLRDLMVDTIDEKIAIWDKVRNKENPSGPKGSLTVYYKEVRGAMEHMEQQEAEWTFITGEDEVIVITKYSGAGGELVIPGMIEGNPVTGIGKKAFAHCSGLKSVIIPESVTSIGDCAFYECSGLESVIIPKGVTSIGDAAFARCTGLKSMVIPEGVISIGFRAFYKCGGLESVIIPGGVTSIGFRVFYDCDGLTSLVIPKGVTSIGNGTFSFCSGLTLVDIPEGVTSIGKEAFYACYRLTSVAIPDSVTSIGHYAFYECNRLESVVIPKHLSSIDVKDVFPASAAITVRQ